jgi:hypothetical protein
MRLATFAGIGKRDNMYVGILERVLLIKVTLPPFERYNLFHGANFRTIISSKPAHIVLSLKEAPNGNPKYFNGTSPYPQPSNPASCPTFSTRPTGTNADLDKLTFNPAAASKQTRRAPK